MTPTTLVFETPIIDSGVGSCGVSPAVVMGRSETCTAWATPSLVTSPMSERVLVEITRNLASLVSTGGVAVLKSLPLAVTQTKVGSSSSCVATGAFLIKTMPEASISCVRRASPYFSETSSSSLRICCLIRCSELSKACRASISLRSWSASVSSSMTLNLVSRRSLSSRMCSACSSLRSKTWISRVRAPSAVSLVRITSMISSMLRTATWRPSKRCSLAFLRSRRLVDLRRTTSMRCAR